MKGRITGISGPTVTVDLPGLKLFERVAVGEAGLLGEVIRVERSRAVLQVYESTRGLSLGEVVRGEKRPLTVRLGPGLLNRMYDGLQRNLITLAEEQGPFMKVGHGGTGEAEGAWHFEPAIAPGTEINAGDVVGHAIEGAIRHEVLADKGGTIDRVASGIIRSEDEVAALRDGTAFRLYSEWPARTPRPFRRKMIRHQPLITGQRCLDLLFPLARGGTAIFPGGFGTGKTVLEQSIAKFADTDVVVYVGCGERGNEMAEMLEEFSTLNDPWHERPLMERTIVVVNTSNMPVAAREASIYTAVTMAEYYRDQGCHVLLLADSLSRWAEALREISSALEEMPGEEGYPTYLVSRMAGFFARSGVVETLSGKEGSLTMILSVSPPGGDLTEPVTQACLRATGAFYMLDTSLAHRRHFPAINWFQSYSLYGEALGEHFTEKVSAEWVEFRQQCRELLQQEEKLREVAEIVGTEGLQDADRLLMRAAERIRREFLSQNAYTDDAFSPPEETLDRLRRIIHAYRRSKEQLAEGKTYEEICGKNDATC